MDLTTYRLDQSEKRAEAADARMMRIEEKLGAIQVMLAAIPTKSEIRNLGVTLGATVVATGLATGAGIGAVVLQSSSNQLAAFQAGLSAIQAITAAAQSGAHASQPQQAEPAKP